MVIALLLSLAQPARWQSYAIHGGLQAGDFVSTELSIGRGARELNPLPFMQSRGGRVAAKAIVSIGVSELDYQLMRRKQRRVAWALRILNAGISSYAIIHNVRTGR